MSAKCPAEVLSAEGPDVKYSKDFEGDNSQVGWDLKQNNSLTKYGENDEKTVKNNSSDM